MNVNSTKIQTVLFSYELTNIFIQLDPLQHFNSNFCNIFFVDCLNVQLINIYELNRGMKTVLQILFVFLWSKS